MSDKSAIEWTDATWNPTRGCTKIAQGCKNCYAETFAERFRGVPGHPYEQGFDPRLVPDQLDAPLRWKKPRKIFVDSMSDLFHESFPFEYIAAVYAVMALTPRHTYQVLTKRPARAAEFFDWLGYSPIERLVDASLDADELAMSPATWEWPSIDPAWPLPNVLHGTSIAHQPDADRNIPYLLQIPGRRFLSIEPLIGPVHLRRQWFRYAEIEGSIVRPRGGATASIKRWHAAIHWVIVGGESGHGARPMHPDWPRSLRDQCVAAGVPFFFKQHGEWIGIDDMERLPLMAPQLADPDEYFAEYTFLRGDHCRGVHCGATPVYRVGKKAAGRLLDGRTWDEFPSTEARTV